MSNMKNLITSMGLDRELATRHGALYTVTNDMDDMGFFVRVVTGGRIVQGCAEMFFVETGHWQGAGVPGQAVKVGAKSGTACTTWDQVISEIKKAGADPEGPWLQWGDFKTYLGGKTKPWPFYGSNTAEFMTAKMERHLAN